MKNTLKMLVLLVIVVFGGCIDPYNPPAITAPNKYLVVEGIINSGVGPTTIRLSYTRNLLDTSNYTIDNAKVYVEGQSGGSFELLSKSKGQYQIEQLNLNPQEKYRLHIKIADGNEYASEYESVLKSPEIDSVTWENRAEGVQIAVTTHDDSSVGSKYYQWTFDETWEFHSAFPSSMKYENGNFFSRPPDEQIYTCFRHDGSKIITVGSSDQLSENIIYKNPIITISQSTSDRLSVKYSILVKQNVLTKQGFEYWQNIKKVTESIGSLFDPQPSHFQGNIRNLNNSGDPVLGFVTVSDVQVKRLFISRAEYGHAKNVFTGYESCIPDTIPGNGDIPKIFNPADIPLYEFAGIGGTIHKLVGTRSCTDCRERGSIVRPDFWQ